MTKAFDSMVRELLEAALAGPFEAELVEAAVAEIEGTVAGQGLQLAVLGALAPGRRWNINDLPDKRARTIAAHPLEEHEYHQNIAACAAAMVQAGLGDATYSTQYSSGSCYFHTPEGLAYGATLRDDGRVGVTRIRETVFLFGPGALQGMQR